MIAPNRTTMLVVRVSWRSYCSTNGSTSSGGVPRVPLIAAKRRYLDFYGRRKDRERPLISHGWRNRKSKGDYFIINAVEPMNEVRETGETGGAEARTFADLGLRPELVTALAETGVTVPTEIQARAVPAILSGRNAMLAAETGCGKTLAYLLPVLDEIVTWKSYESEARFNSPSAIVVAPNRELALQISNVAETLCARLDLKTKSIIGGHTKRLMVNAEFEDIDLLIGSFGAVSKMVTSKVYGTDRLHHVVLDEADTLLDDSFIEKLEALMKKFTFCHRMTLPPQGCQLTMASATMPKTLPEEVRNFVDVDSLKKITTNNLHRILPHVPQRFLRMGRSDRPFELLKLVRVAASKKMPVMIFANSSATCNWISIFLNEQGVDCVNFNGDIPREIKAEQYNKFRSGEVNVISCTDIGSRGLDTTRVKHVINYDFPYYVADYIHRCGRTGRLGSPEKCRITNFVSSNSEIEVVQKIETAARDNSIIPNVNANIKGLITRHYLKTNNMAFTSSNG